MTASRPPETPGAKMQYLIRRRATTTREELIAHWFANHMPAVIARQETNRAAGELHAERYVATLFDPDEITQLAVDAGLVVEEAMTRAPYEGEYPTTRIYLRATRPDDP